MSSFPPPPPSLGGMQHSYTTHGSVGAVIGVLAVVLVLGAAAVFVGRLCSGRPILGQTRAHYDMEGWVESKCSSCVDGRLFRPPPPQPQHHPPPQQQHHQQHQPSAANNDGGDDRHESRGELPTQSNVGGSP